MLVLHFFPAFIFRQAVGEYKTTEACSRLKRGHGLFLFADRTILGKDPFSPVWQWGESAKISALLDLPEADAPFTKEIMQEY